MARYVKISTIGMRSPQGANSHDWGRVVEETISRMKKEIDQVLPDRPDLIVLPEFCDLPLMYGYTPADYMEYYCERENKVQNFLSEISKENSCYITYPAFIETAEGRTNSTSIIDRNGNVIGKYNKNHLTIGEIEEYGLVCGKDAPLIECDFGHVACATCFDLNFNDLRLKYAGLRPDILIFSSMYHGGLMQNYWAYSCRSHFVGAIWNDISSIISPVGEIIASSTNYFDFVTANVNLDCAVVHVDFNLDGLKALKEKYGSGISIFDPGHLGSVLISNEMVDCSIDCLIKEFEIEYLDDYFARALRLRSQNLIS